MPNVTINGVEVTVPQGSNLIQAAEEAGAKVPFFCYHPGLSVPANCRMCLVEIEGGRKLEPGCYTKVRDGMVVHTDSEKVQQARQSVLEFILVNHPIDCPICDQAGECWLQDHYMAYDHKPSRVRTEKVSKVKVHPIGPNVVYDGERCILCTRCVRFCEEITETHELTVVERGDNAEIRTFPGKKLDNDYSMCVADICPVGALTARPFRFKRRVWRLESSPSICTGCSRGCSVFADYHHDALERYVPRENLDINEYWMCDAGRLTALDQGEGRLRDIVVRGQTIEYWPKAMRSLVDTFEGKDGTARKWGLLLSPYASTESLAAAVAFAETCLDGAQLFRGGNPEGHSDDFLIRADKNANGAGLDAVTSAAEVREIGGLIDAIEKGDIDSLYMMGNDIPVSHEDELFSWFGNAVQRLDVFVVHSPWKGRYAEHATVLLPAASHLEQKGTFINCDDIHQTVPAAFAPDGSGLPDWEIFLRLSRALRKPLGFADWAGAAALAGLAEDQLAEPVVGERHNLSAPHGPHRTIPGRAAGNDADALRPWWMDMARGAVDETPVEKVG